MRVDAAFLGPSEFVVVGKLHVGADEGVFRAEADAVAESEIFEDARGVLRRIMREERHDRAVAALRFSQLVVDRRRVEPGIPDMVDGRMRSEQAGQLESIAIGDLHAFGKVAAVFFEDLEIAGVDPAWSGGGKVIGKESARIDGEGTRHDITFARNRFGQTCGDEIDMR